MTGKSRTAVNLEYAALRVFCAVVNAVPYPVAMAAARALAALAFDVFRFKRRRTLGRIHSVFPAISPREARSIARRSLANVLQSGVEMIRAPRLGRRWMDAHVVDGLFYKERLQEYVDEGRGVVVMVPHSGNWYMAAWSMAAYGLPLAALAAKQKNPKIDAWMKRQYGSIEVMDRGGASTLVKVRAKLEEGRAFAILPDLRVMHRDVEVGFLGGRANVSHSGALLAVDAGCPIVVAAMRREGGRHVFRHIATLRPAPASPDPVQEARRLTAEAMRLLDEEIRSNPGDWYWYNKRWILEPVAC